MPSGEWINRDGEVGVLNLISVVGASYSAV